MDTEATAVPTTTPTTEKTTIAPPAKPSVDIVMTDKQRDKWLLTGKEPDSKISDTPEPKEAEHDTATEAKSDTDAGTESKPEQEQKPSKSGLTSMGHKQLRERIRELEAQVAASNTAPKAETAQVEEPKAKTEKMRDKPGLEDKNKDGTPKYESWEAYNEDLIDWKAEQKFTEYRKNEEKAKQDATVAAKNREIAESWKGRVDKAAEKYTDFAEVALDEKKGPGSVINPGSVLDAWILDSDLGAEILYHFGKNRSDLDRIGALHPIAAARELAKLELKLSGEPSKAPTAEAELKPEPKVTKAPPPARDIGGRGTTATDPVRKAVEDGDFEAYQAAANRKAIAASK